MLASLFLPVTPSRAQESVPTEVVATAEVRQEVPSVNGRPVSKFVPAAELKQGDEVFFTLHIRNATAVVAPDVVVIWPIPVNTVYVPRSATAPAADVSFSVDGGRTFAKSTELRARDPLGEPRKATERDYTHIRWRLRYPLAPGAVALARFRAIFQ